ncbi:hypothetical protein BMW24_001370 [Mycobacterium heckeshornense]|uniref:Uncharacterized protein n=1 Tax=Mycobacterium heckeshornense TaxID=110505 RepID=A0A2G8BJK3_9MYCO|nr:hypothetical protein [Mycobacterium heckeshornense]KMV21207.1 hypothetical protein ACT16_17880 [Mycobacterium heckeshornense]MCV7035675.1 hypothetical protein [Mycobacterium heckeshornense]PIJ37786.1 hypothetical protein BMW24_001370 [Mycobacterium heckeshornense]BCO37723.1 hypothetical protein MHEC_41560 [Mycobacterium heckeshornense]BCQ10591.1 hypothetical protein JMUB5695_04049 [Mycobacterium heckeshornense]
MTEFTPDDQWRSFQTFVATYLAGMLHPRDVFTISRKSAVAPPLVEFRCDAAGRLWFSMGALSWSDEDGAAVQISRENLNQVAAQTVRVLRDQANLDDPSELRLSGSGPASSVAVLARAGFMSGTDGNPARVAVLHARMSANIDTEGDVIEAAARAVGRHALAASNNGSIASIAFAAELARLRSWVDPFSPTPKSGYLVGGGSPTETEE